MESIRLVLSRLVALIIDSIVVMDLVFTQCCSKGVCKSLGIESIGLYSSPLILKLYSIYWKSSDEILSAAVRDGSKIRRIELMDSILQVSCY